MNRQEGKYKYKNKDGQEKTYTGTKLAIRPNREQKKKVFDKTIRKMKEISIIHYGMESDVLTYKIKKRRQACIGES